MLDNFMETFKWLLESKESVTIISFLGVIFTIIPFLISILRLKTTVENNKKKILDLEEVAFKIFKINKKIKIERIKEGENIKNRLNFRIIEEKRGSSFLGYSLTLKILSLALKDFKKKQKTKQNKEEKVLILFLLKSKTLKIEKILTVLILSFIASLIFFIFNKENFLLMLITLTVLTLYLIYFKILEYRVKNGYFGGNKYEAMEILDYFHQNKDDFFNHDGEIIFCSQNNIKKIFDFSFENKGVEGLSWI